MIKLNVDKGDIALKNKKAQLNNAIEEIVQRILLKISLDKGDYFLNKNLGIPWTSEIFPTKNEKKQKELIYKYIKKTIEEDRSFKSLNYINININNSNRKLNVEFSFNTDFGNITSTVEKVV